MSQSALVVHRGARVVTREELDNVPAPPPTDTWFPLTHSHVLDRTLSTLDQAGFHPKRTQLALSRGDAKFFATIDLESPIAEGVALAVGVRNSIDKSLPIAFAAGERIFVCDNLAFRGEVAVARKHTRFGADRFAEAMAKAVSGLAQFQEAEGRRITYFRKTEIQDTMAESLILRAYERQILSHLQLPRVLSQWRKPPFEAFEDRTLWSLENAFTSALADVGKTNPQRFCGLTIALQGLLAEAAGASEPQFAMPA
ncbi:MAG TPA: DUF932 domain-containing protein [Gemmataceae bacterium]|nr:DUF932 domain-containing protein [Gemmataceae bacterium]